MFLNGGRISEGLVMVSLAFHLFVVGTVSFASVLLCQVKSRTSLFLQRKMWVPHIKNKVYICSPELWSRVNNNKPTVSVDVKQHSINQRGSTAQELCESRGGCPGLPSLIRAYGFCRRKATLQQQRGSVPNGPYVVSAR